jgi:hypothetical protein
MTVYAGSESDTPISLKVERLSCGAGRIACLECEGTGDWTRFHPEPELHGGKIACPDLVSV